MRGQLMKTRLGQLLVMVLPPVGLFVLLVAIWQIRTGLGSTPDFKFPAPLRISQAAWHHRWDLLRATGLTAAAALAGLAASLVVGMLMAVPVAGAAEVAVALVGAVLGLFPMVDPTPVAEQALPCPPPTTRRHRQPHS